MNLFSKSISKEFVRTIALILVLAVLAWLFWADIKTFILGKEYQRIQQTTAKPLIDNDLKKQVLENLGKLRQYGEWPISGVKINENRQNPFEPKQEANYGQFE